MSVAVMGSKIPLYGSGASLSNSTGTATVPVSLKLSFVIRSSAYVLRRLVKPKYYQRIEWSITLDPKKISVPVSLKNSCTYDWVIKWEEKKKEKKKHIENSIKKGARVAVLGGGWVGSAGERGGRKEVIMVHLCNWCINGLIWSWPSYRLVHQTYRCIADGT